MADDPFRVLGVTVTATADEITDAWRARMRELHPDANAGASETEKAALTARAAAVNAAYNELKSDLAAARERVAPIRNERPAATSSHQWVQPPPMMPARIPGGWLFRRPLTWVLLAVAMLAGLVILNEIGTPEPAQNPVTQTSYVPPVGWYAGNCVAGTQVVVPVRCSVEHTGRITAQVGAQEYCPAGTDATVLRENVFFCVDKDQ